jgi:preprotein translocase subunit SecE
MSKDKAMAPGALGMFFQELRQVGIYKRTQGRMARQFTCLAVWLAFALAAGRMFYVVNWGFVDDWFPSQAISAAHVLKYAVPTMLLVTGVWLGYRLVNYAPFADFLIAVEAEMNKVTWPSRAEMVRSAVVVIVIMLGLTIVIFAYDNILRLLLALLNIVDWPFGLDK